MSESGLKQRLVGAVMLVALAVIVIPWLLDGAGVEYGYRPRMDIPERPPAPRSLLPERPLARPAPQPQEAPASGGAQIERDAAPPAGDAPVAAAADSEAEAEAAAPALADPQPSPLRAWVVQVASVRSEPNARRLAEELRGAGFPAFVQTYGEAGERRYRVRVGPVARRDQAQAVLERLAADHGQKGVVYNHP